MTKFFLTFVVVFLTSVSATAQVAGSMVFFWAQDVENSELRALGSGFLIDREGLILTARHVVEGIVEGERVVVSISSKSDFPSQIDDTLIGCAAAGQDICLVRVPPDAVPTTLNEVFSLECERVAPSAPVLAMGFVGGGDRFGGVQQQRGHVTGAPVSGGLIPTDLPLVPTMSGGPVLNAEGHVIGVIKGADNTSDNLTFFTPLTAASTILLNAGIDCPRYLLRESERAQLESELSRLVEIAEQVEISITYSQQFVIPALRRYAGNPTFQNWDLVRFRVEEIQSQLSRAIELEVEFAAMLLRSEASHEISELLQRVSTLEGEFEMVRGSELPGLNLLIQEHGQRSGLYHNILSGPSIAPPSCNGACCYA